jgi:thioester reductase-like protein
VVLSNDADDGILAGNLLLTGATGFVGAALLAETLLSTDTEVVCLVRAGSVHEAQERVLAALRPWLGVDRAEASLHRVRALPADITSPEMGLPEPTWNELAEWSTHIVHCAATVRFDEPFDVASAVNVTGALRVLDLARAATHAGSLARAVMVSTAFVAGTTARVFAEHDLDLGQGFRNTYERSKFEAEQHVQRAAAEIPVCVVRPSIVVGHSETGQTTAFNVLYAPMRLLLRHIGSATLPVRAGNAVDTVPVDWVAHMILTVLASGQDGMTYAAASAADALTTGDVASIAGAVFGVAAPCLLPADASDVVVSALALAWRERLSPRESTALAAYAPYMMRAPRFDAWRGEQLMRRSGHRRTDPREVLVRCLEYARATNFGRLRAGAPSHARPAGAKSPSAVA